MARILVIGKGGREHSLAWKLSQSPHVKHVYVVPGNPGMISDKISIHNANTLSFKDLVNFVNREKISWTIVGSEVELAAGMVDYFRKKNLLVFGPNKYCAQIESSKEFCKNKMKEFAIPTANFKVFEDPEEAIKYIRKGAYPLVIKANGLAAGKGVLIAEKEEEAIKMINDCLLKNVFQMDQPKIIIEEFLKGIEFSLFGLSDGKNIIFTPVSQDYKRLLDRNKGPNTGGMGVQMPIDEITETSIKEGQEIIKKMINGLRSEGYDYQGVVYAGLIQTRDGVKVIEFNSRFGDPECQVLMSALKTDLYEIINSLLTKKPLPKIEWDTRRRIGVVIVAKGYPNHYSKEIPLKKTDYPLVFYMGVSQKGNHLMSSGGRVFIVIGVGDTIQRAQNQAYKQICDITDGDSRLFYRGDIGVTYTL